MLVFGQGGCKWAKVVVNGQKGLYSDKSSCIRESGCIWEKVVVFGQMWFY